jgi:DNA topoisomerase-2
MNTPSSKFGSKCEVSDKFIEKVAKMGVMDAALQLTEVKENKAAKKTDGVKSKSVRGIPKLTDANWAGTDKSKECMIIFCEGDSAKAGIISGLSSDDRNTIGVYPMKGKILNVRGEAVKKISENKEITEIKKILGLETGKKYADMEDVHKSLRYGRVLFMTDQDLDGSHIKGLGINLFQSEWPTLANIPGFIGFMNTPILKAKKGTVELDFYNEGEYNEWKEENDIKGWKIKYYKGLGTSTGKEFREYFEKKKVVGFEHSEKSDDAIDMVFNKKRADDRKDWLKVYDRDAYLDTSKTCVSYEEFIDRELIHFSKYDCDRSIPNLMDGLKISLRKILFSAFKKNLTNEIKVAQFSGYVSEHSGYHHGEASLNGAIVGMAQNFVGSNNINLLMPNGQFGTRLQGGKDSASERYIFTQLNKITRSLFPVSDDNVLKYLNDDGLLVEPLYYAPIIPMVLVNGSKGIGTGFSTDIMCYNPLQIIEYIKNKLLSIEDDFEFIPYYEGFKGVITKLSDEKFLVKGVYEKTGPDKIKVTELPVGYWTEDFKELLEDLIEPTPGKDGKKVSPIIKDYDDMSKDTNVDFTITFAKGKLEELESNKGDYGCNGLEKTLKLYTTNSTSNMHLFDAEDSLKKFDKVSDIIDSYYEVRLKLYQERKNYMIAALERELILLSNKAKYIQENLDGTIDLRKKKKEHVIQLLVSKDYDIIDDDEEYKYLVKMPMDSVTEENVEKLLKDKGNKETELETIKIKTIHKMWNEELDSLRNLYIDYKEERARLMSGEDGSSKSSKKKVVSKGPIKKSVKSNEGKKLLIVEDD